MTDLNDEQCPFLPVLALGLVIDAIPDRGCTVHYLVLRVNDMGHFLNPYYHTLVNKTFQMEIRDNTLLMLREPSAPRAALTDCMHEQRPSAGEQL